VLAVVQRLSQLRVFVDLVQTHQFATPSRRRFRLLPHLLVLQVLNLKVTLFRHEFRLSLSESGGLRWPGQSRREGNGGRRALLMGCSGRFYHHIERGRGKRWE
jgi:hypothetical protein